MTSAMTESVRDQDQEEQNYSMPQATQGMTVLWFPNGLPNRSSVRVAYMLQCGGRTAVLQVSDGRRLDAVRHITDPKLRLNEDQRENGAWDFTDDYKELIEFRAVMEDRIVRLERRDYELVKDRHAKRKEAGKIGEKDEDGRTLRGQRGANRLSRYQELRCKAKEMELKIPFGIKLVELERLIADNLPESEHAELPIVSPRKLDLMDELFDDED